MALGHCSSELSVTIKQVNQYKISAARHKSI